jgi:hypothetical protein
VKSSAPSSATVTRAAEPVPAAAGNPRAFRLLRRIGVDEAVGDLERSTVLGPGDAGDRRVGIGRAVESAGDSSRQVDVFGLAEYASGVYNGQDRTTALDDDATATATAITAMTFGSDI